MNEKKYIVMVLKESYDEYTKVIDIETFDNRAIAAVSYRLHVTKYREQFAQVYEELDVYDTEDGKAISNSDGTEICHVKLIESDYFESGDVPKWLEPVNKK